MKKNQLKELKAKTKVELEKLLISQKADLSRILIDLKSKKLKNVALVTNKKKIMAVISTFIREKELAKI